MRNFLSVIFGLIILTVAAVFIVPRLIDWNNYKTSIAQHIKHMTGRELIINGNIRIAVLPAPALVAEDLLFTNSDDATSPFMATLKSAEMRVALIPLLAGRIQVETIKLIKPVINLERLKNGRVNWEFRTTKEMSKSSLGAVSKIIPGEKKYSMLPIALENLSIEKGTLIYSDPGSDISERIEDLSAEIIAASLRGPMETNGTAIVRGIPVSFGLNIGEIIHGRTLPISLRASSEVGRASLQMRGALVNLGKLPKFKGDFKLNGDDLAAVLTSMVSTVSSHLLSRPFNLNGVITATIAEVQMENLELGFGKTRATGDLRVEFGDKLIANSRLELKTLDLDEMTNITGRRSIVGAKATRNLVKPAQKILPAEATPLRFALPKSFEASIIVSVDTIAFRNDLIRDAVFNARLRDGVLKVNQFSAQFPGGSDLAASMQLYTPDGIPTFKADIESAISDFRGILGWLEVAIPGVAADRLRKISVRAQINGTLEQFQIRNIDLYFDSSHLTGGLTLALRKRWALGANLTLDRLNLDSYIQPLKSETSRQINKREDKTNLAVDSEGGGGTFNLLMMLSRFDANIKAQVKSLVFKSKPIRGLVLDATLFKGSVDIRHLSIGKFSSASVSVTGKIKELIGVPKFEEFKFETRIQDPARLVRALGMLARPVSRAIGEVKAEGQVNGNLLNPKIIFSSEVAGAVIGVEGEYSLLSAADVMKGQITLKHTDLSALLRRFGVLYRPAARLGAIDLNAEIRTSFNDISIKNFRAALGELNLSGEANIDLSGPRPMIKASIESGALAVDKYLSVPKKAVRKSSGMVIQGSQASPKIRSKTIRSQFSKKIIDFSSLNLVDADVTFKAPILIYGKLLVENPDVLIRIKDSNLSVPKLTGRIFEGNLTASMKVTNGTRNRLSLIGGVDGVNIEKYLSARKPVGGSSANGRMKFHWDLSSFGRSIHELISQLRGSGSFAFTDLNITKLGKGSMVANMLEPLEYFSKLAGSMPNNRANMAGNFRVKRGVVQSKDITFESSYGTGFASGEINLPGWSVNMKGKLELAQSLIAKLLKADVPRKHSAIPFIISGALGDLNVKMDTDVLLNRSVSLIEIDKILDERPKGVGSLLRGILGTVNKMPRSETKSSGPQP